MLKKLSLGFICTALAILLLCAISVSANPCPKVSGGSVAAIENLSAVAVAVQLLPLKHSPPPPPPPPPRHVVTPEPATWLYVLGAVLLALVFERKSIKLIFARTASH
jgi:hypothetical protein